MLTLAGLAVLTSVGSDLAGPSTRETAHPAISRTAWVAAAAWYSAMALRWYGSASMFCVVYGWGCVMYLLHVVAAFHLGHDWSHALAFDHVERRSGFGSGIFVSYAFTLCWLLDAAWCGIDRNRYFGRRRSWNLGIYGFQGFVVVNASIVFVGMGSSVTPAMEVSPARSCDIPLRVASHTLMRW